MGVYKESFSEKRTKLGDVLPINTPYTLLLDIADVCNFKCNYCFRSDPQCKPEDYKNNVLMDMKTFYTVADQLKEFPDKIKRLSFSHNGESLCNPRLPEMIQYAREKELADCCEIHTNASLLTFEKSKQLIEAGINRIVISLQGLTDDAYLKNCGVRINVDELYEKIAYLYNNKKDNLKIYIKIVDSVLENKDQLFIEKYSKISDAVFIEKVIPLWGSELKTDGVYMNKYGKFNKWQKCCPLVFYTIGVLPSGIIYPCSHIEPPFKLGSVFDNTLYNAWNSSERINFLKKLLESGRNDIDKCKSCYIPQNSVFTDEDKIDDYTQEILSRLKEK